MGLWCKQYNKKVRTSEWKMTTRDWFIGNGEVSTGEKWTFKKVQNMHVSRLSKAQRWGFTFSEVVEHDYPAWNHMAVED